MVQKLWKIVGTFLEWDWDTVSPPYLAVERGLATGEKWCFISRRWFVMMLSQKLDSLAPWTVAFSFCGTSTSSIALYSWRDASISSEKSAWTFLKHRSCWLCKDARNSRRPPKGTDNPNVMFTACYCKCSFCLRFAVGGIASNQCNSHFRCSMMLAFRQGTEAHVTMPHDEQAFNPCEARNSCWHNY